MVSRIASRHLGDFEIVVMKDGGAEFDHEVFPDQEESRINDLLISAGKGKIETNFHAVLLRRKKQCILIDAGAREFFGPGGGQFPLAMEEANLDADDVDILVVTHLHPDHIGGMIKENGEAVFPKAEMVVTDKEYAFWTDDSNFLSADDHKKSWREIALSVLKSYGERVSVVRPDTGIVPNVSFVDMPGHTAGHAGVRVDSAGKMFIHTADILHAPDLQLADPEISAVFDTDKTAAIATRKRILDMIAHDHILFTGSHFLNCQIGYLEKSGNGYRLSESEEG